MDRKVKEEIREILSYEFSHLHYQDRFLPLFEDFFKKIYGNSLIAVIFYGSKLFEPENKDSLYDFYVIVDSYEKVHRSPLHIILNRILPPSVYLAEVEMNGEKRYAKSNIISFEDLKKSILEPTEIYIIGRFAKKIHILFAKNEKARREIESLCVESQYFCLTYTIPLMKDREKFKFEELVKEILSLSYKGEVRIEDPQKIEKLYEPFKDFYLKVYSKHFEYYLSENEGVVIDINLSEDIMQKEWAVIGDTIPTYEEVVKFLKSSAKKGVLRWPKGLITFKGYREYLERKAKKSREEINITELDRKMPLIFGWRHVIKLIRQGKLKSGIQKEIEMKKSKQM